MALRRGLALQDIRLNLILLYGRFRREAAIFFGSFAAYISRQAEAGKPYFCNRSNRSQTFKTAACGIDKEYLGYPGNDWG